MPLLDLTQGNDLVEAIEVEGGDPHEFEFTQTVKQATVKHRASTARLAISRPQGRSWRVKWVAGRAGAKSQRTKDFPRFDEEIPAEMRMWVKRIEELAAIPDRWAALEQERDAFSRATLMPGENTPFTPEEQRSIEGKLRELTTSIGKEHELSSGELDELTSRMDYLIEASKRLGRFDWRNLVVGTLAGAAFNAYLSPDTVRTMVSTTLSSVSHLFGAPLPQLPS